MIQKCSYSMYQSLKKKHCGSFLTFTSWSFRWMAIHIIRVSYKRGSYYLMFINCITLCLARYQKNWDWGLLKPVWVYSLKQLLSIPFSRSYVFAAWKVLRNYYFEGYMQPELIFLSYSIGINRQPIQEKLVLFWLSKWRIHSWHHNVSTSFCMGM